MRVLHTVDSLDARHGGPSRSVPTLAGALAAAGADVRLAVWERDGASGYRQGLRARPALLHDHGLWLASNHAGARLARRTAMPRVVSPRGMLEPWALAHRAWKKRAAWVLYQRRDLADAAVVHATSDAEAASVRRAGVRVPVAVIPNGVEGPPGDRPPPAGPRRRALFLSRIHPKKGLPLLVEAWARTRPAGWELVVAGPDEGGHRAAVEALVHQVGQSDAVHFHGPIDDAGKWDLYRSADLFVLPSHSENFGLVVAEALAAGVPVLTTTATPWAELPAQGCGWHVAPAAAALEAALAEATALAPETLTAMGARGRALVAERYSWDHAAHEMIAAYRWVLRQGPRPACVHLD